MLSAIILASLLAQAPGMCQGADLAITDVHVRNVSTDDGNKVYHLAGTVQNVGHTKQPGNTLQFVDVSIGGTGKVDTRGIPPLAPGQRYTFGYDFKRSADAGDGSSRLRFRLDFRQPAGSADRNTSNGTFALMV